MKILTIGSEGNIGKELVKYLNEKGHSVIECDIKPGWRKNYYQADINIPIDLFEIFANEKPDVVYLLAAMVSRVTCEASSGLAIETNLVGLNNIIQLCKKFNSKLVYFSTSEVYGNNQGILDEDVTIPQPNNRYGLTKYLGEKIVQYEAQFNGLRAVAVRPFMFYHEDETRGDHRSAMIRFIEGLSSFNQIEVHVGSERAWLHLDDAVIALEKVMYLDNFEIINIGSDEFVKTEDLAKMIAEELNVKLEDYANFVELPEKMTLIKRPKLEKMKKLLGVTPKINLLEGVRRVISKF